MIITGILLTLLMLAILNLGTVKTYKRTSILNNYGKGGGTVVETTAPPSSPSSAEAIEAWVNSLPQVYETQMQYAPQEAQQQLEMIQQFALPIGQALQQAQAALYPETAGLQEQLAARASRGMEEGLTPEEEESYRQRLSANLGTNIGSGVGANYVSRGLTEYEQGRKDYYSDLGLTTAGRQALSQPMAPQTTDYASTYTPGSVMNFMQQGYGSYAPLTRPLGFTPNQQQSYLWGAYSG